jgi:hypothetical protein
MMHRIGNNVELLKRPPALRGGHIPPKIIHNYWKCIPILVLRCGVHFEINKKWW